MEMSFCQIHYKQKKGRDEGRLVEPMDKQGSETVCVIEPNHSFVIKSYKEVKQCV